MFNYIHGFSQSALILHGITLSEALVIKWFLQFAESNRMLTIEIDGEKFYWVSYTKVIDDLPIIFNRGPLTSEEEKEKLRTKSKQKTRRLLKSLCQKGILRRAIVNNNTTYFSVNEAIILRLL